MKNIIFSPPYSRFVDTQDIRSSSFERLVLPTPDTSAGLPCPATGGTMRRRLLHPLRTKATQVALDQLRYWKSQGEPSEMRVDAAKRIKDGLVGRCGRLDLSLLLLQDLPDCIGEMPKLKGLILDGNALTNLPDSIGNLKSLQTLSVADNQLQSLPDSIGNLMQLRELNVQNNQLQSLPNVMGRLGELIKYRGDAGSTPLFMRTVVQSNIRRKNIERERNMEMTMERQDRESRLLFSTFPFVFFG